MANSQFPNQILQRVESCGVIAVLVVDQVNRAVPLAQALLAGGVDCLELTLRTPVALDALSAIRQDVPQMLVGIGTILTPQQVEQVAKVGAAFGVSPGTNPRVVRAAQAAGLPFAPGIVTPSDIEVAIELGCRELKFFPAEPSGGIEYLKNMVAPFLHLGVRFIPLGGITLSNLESYLRETIILAVGGSWLAPRQLIDQQAWSEIEARARQARSVVQRVRGGQT